MINFTCPMYLLGLLCLSGATFALVANSDQILGSNQAQLDEIAKEENPDEILAKLWDQSGPKLEHWKTEAYLRQFVKLTQNRSEQQYAEARNDVDLFLNIANIHRLNVGEQCELEESPISAINSAAYPQNIAHLLEISKGLFEESCQNYALQTIGRAFERIPAVDSEDLNSLMTRIGIRANNLNGPPPSSRLVGAGSLAYLSSKVNLRDVRFSPLAGIDGTMNYAIEYTKHVISLCNTLLWAISAVEPNLIKWLPKDHSEYETWKLWTRRGEVCQVVFNERDTIISDSYWALAQKMKSH